MVFGVRCVVQLCWTVSLILPLVQAQIDGDRFGGNGSSNGTRSVSKNTVVNTNSSPFQDGGFVGELSKIQNPPEKTGTSGNQEQQQQQQKGQEVVPNNKAQPENNQLTPLVLPPSAAGNVLAPTQAAAIVGQGDGPPLPNENTWAAVPTLQNGGPSPTTAPVSATSTPWTNTWWSPEPTIVNSERIISSSRAVTSALATTVLVPSPPLTTLVTSSSSTAVTAAIPPANTLATQSSTTPISASPTSPQQNQVPTATPTAADAPSSMSAGARIGVGIGVTLVVVSIAAAAGFFLYRRRRNRHQENTDFSQPRASVRSSSGLNLLRRDTCNTEASDQEWSIESAEKVEIVCIANARSFSRNSVREIINERPGSSQGVMKVGMAVENPDTQARQDRAKNRYTAALTSNPPSPPPESNILKTSASEVPKAAPREGANVKEEKKGSWPLQD